MGSQTLYSLLKCDSQLMKIYERLFINSSNNIKMTDIFFYLSIYATSYINSNQYPKIDVCY